MDSAKKNPGRRPPTKSSSNSQSRSDSPSIATKPPPRAQGTGQPVLARPQRPSYVDDREAQEDVATIHDREVHDADEDSDEWIEIEDVDEAENHENDEMSDHCRGEDNKEEGDDVVDITETQMSRTEVAAGKRKKKSGVVVVAKKKTRVKRAECWKYFKLVKAVSKRRSDEIVEKAKCLGCLSLLCYQGGTTSLNRHRDSCYQIQNKKARALRQGTIAFDPEMPGASLIVNHEYDHAECKMIIAKMIIAHEYPFRMVEHAWFNILMRDMNASYKFIGRKTIPKECMKVYLSEKEILKKQLRSVESISLTCDLWTSNQICAI